MRYQPLMRRQTQCGMRSLLDTSMHDQQWELKLDLLILSPVRYPLVKLIYNLTLQPSFIYLFIYF